MKKTFVKIKNDNSDDKIKCIGAGGWYKDENNECGRDADFDVFINNSYLYPQCIYHSLVFLMEDEIDES